MGKNYKKWTLSDKSFIMEHQNSLDKDVAAQMSELIGQPVSESMIRRQRRKNGIVKSRGRPRKNTNINTQQGI